MPVKAGWSRFLHFAVLALVAVIMMAGILEFRARSELALAREALSRSEVPEALKHYSRALNWYVPFGSAETAAQELLELGLKLKDQGHFEEARLALSRLRSGLYGDRGFYTPRMDLIKRAETPLAELMARFKLGKEAKKADLKAAAQTYLDLYDRPTRPGIGPALAAVGGFLIWVAGALLFIIQFSLNKKSWGKTWPWALIWSIGFVIWLWGLKWA